MNFVTRTASDANRELSSRRWVNVNSTFYKAASARAERRAAKVIDTEGFDLNDTEDESEFSNTSEHVASTEGRLLFGKFVNGQFVS